MATITSLGFNIQSNWDGSGVREARNDLMKLQEDMRRISGASLRIDVDVDTSRARAEIEQLRQSVSDIRVGVDLENADFLEAEGAIEALTRDRTIDVRMDHHNMTGQIADISRHFDGASGSAASFGGAASGAGRMGTIAMVAFGAALVALPGLINLVGAALMTGLAGSIIAVGAIALHNDEQIRASWERLKDDGIRIFKEAAAPMRDEFVGALDMVRERLNELAPAFRDAFANAAPLIRPLTDALLDLVQNAMPGIQEAMRNMGPVIEGLRQGMANFGTSISNMFSGMAAGAQGLGQVMNVTFTQIGVLMENFGVAAGQMAETGTRVWEGLLRGVNDLLKGFLDGLTGFMAAASGPLGQLLQTVGSQLGDAFRQILPALGEFVAALAELAGPVLQALLPPLAEFTRSALSGLTPAIRGLTPLIVALADGLGTIIRWLGPAAPIIVGVTVAWWGLNAALAFAAANPVVAIIAGITALVAGIVYLATRTQFFQTIWRNVWDFISMRWEQFRSTIVNAWNATWDFLTMRWQQFTGTFSNAWNSLWSGVNSFFQTIWQNIQRSWDTLLNAIRTAWTTASNALSTAWNAFWGAIKAFAEGIWTSIKTAWDGVLGGIRMAWDAGSSALRTAWEGAWNGIKAVGEGIWNAIKAAWQFHVDGVRQVWDLFSNALRGAWDTFWNAIKAAGEFIWNAVKQAWQNFVDGLRAIWDFFSNALRAAWDNYWNAVKAAGEFIWNVIKQAWQNFVDGLRAIWDFFSNALRQAWDAFWNAIKAAGEFVWNGLRIAWDGLFQAFTGIWNTFKGMFEGAWSGMWNGVKAVAEGVWEGLKGGFNAVKDKIIETIDFLVREVKRIWDQITGFFEAPVNTIKDIWNGVAGTFGLPTIAKAKGGEVIERASGGSVHGMGGPVGDKIPAYLSNNEHVLTSADVDAMGGHNAVYRFRSNLHQPGNFAEGGAVEWMWARVRELQPSMQLTSSYRDTADYHGQGKAIDVSNGGDSTPQMRDLTRQVHDAWGAQTLELIHSPSQFNIKDGRNVGDGMGLYGSGTMSEHRNHVHWAVPHPLDGRPGAAVGGGAGSSGPTAAQIEAHRRAVEQIRQVMDATFGTTATMQHMVRSGQIANMNRAASPDFIGPLPATHLTEAAKNKYGVFAPAGDTHGAGTGKTGEGAIAKLDAALAALAASSVGGSIPEGERRRIIEEALRATATPPPNTLENWLAGMNTLITRESNWNPNAVNNSDSNAAKGTPSKGLAQVIQPTFDAHVPNHLRDRGIMDPVANVAASVAYIKSRYGDISNVQQANASMPPKGYAVGTRNAPAGWAMVGENGPEMVRFRGGEQVKTFEEIISALKDSATGTAKTLETKISAELRSTVERLIAAAQSDNADMRATLEAEIRGLVERMSTDVQASGRQFAEKVEDCIERVLASAGIQVNLPLQAPANGQDVQAYAQQVANQLLPQLEMMIRQRVGAR